MTFICKIKMPTTAVSVVSSVVEYHPSASCVASPTAFFCANAAPFFDICMSARCMVSAGMGVNPSELLTKGPNRITCDVPCLRKLDIVLIPPAPVIRHHHCHYRRRPLVETDIRQRLRPGIPVNVCGGDKGIVSLAPSYPDAV